MNIDDLTIGQVKQLTGFLSPQQKPSPFVVGEKYLFRTVTHIDVGEVVSVCGDFLELKQASWIADTGRYYDCLKDGVFNEVEPYPANVKPYINSATLIDFATWPHDLPSEQK
jgi:hypothetical protein